MFATPSFEAFGAALDAIRLCVVKFGSPRIGMFPPGDPHWKRVAKDRARRKRTKKHKQVMRRAGKG